ncbi:hypothetical protein DYB28_015504 [Aphanomyces astaci]|uniref:Transcription factor CBF/NF-Y/archaeal histone domain-containing protein n=1 Tax=Aphanomyces astaci TaxID=112090 RepID=A0A396ZP51_APHAT|nr:hypothetical protein DYB36_009848 [Aphanomyces astaci]RHY46253.1 hypothetical protein DYB34_010672 [Aphanomyces astaci]RLO01587.1 hypothetical protein DYB28_015504 [Aphanomyces astaci]
MAPPLEYTLPLGTVNRIVKECLGNKAGMTKEARETVQAAAGVFILYLTSAANEECKAKKRQTISAQDVIKALHDVDMDSFVTPLETFLHATKSTKKPVVKASPSIDAPPEHEDNVAPDTSIEEDDEETKDEHIPDDDMNEQDD